MITMQEWIEICNYKITEGSNYCWRCYGMHAYQLESWSGDYPGGYSIDIVFDTRDQTVYEVTAHDYTNERSYRIINPAYAEAHNAEHTARGVDDYAYDMVPYIDLEIEDDFIEKATAIASGKEYNTNILVPLDLGDTEMLQLFKMSHAADMTFNEYCNMILRNMIEELKKEQE